MLNLIKPKHYLFLALMLLLLIAAPLCNPPKLERPFTEYTKPVYILQKDTVYFTKIDTIGQKIIEQSNREFKYHVLLNAKDAELEALKLRLKNQEIDLNNLRYALMVNKIVRDTFNIKTFITQDSLVFAHTSKHLDVKARIMLKDSVANVSYEYRNELTFISHKYQKNIFSRPEMRLRVISADSNATLVTSTFNVKESKPLVTLGVGIGYGVDLRTFRPSPNLSIGVYVPLITIKSKK